MPGTHLIPGFFGKLPTSGDFVTRGLPAPFVRAWDRWCVQHIVPRLDRAWPACGLRFLSPGPVTDLRSVSPGPVTGLRSVSPGPVTGLRFLSPGPASGLRSLSPAPASGPRSVSPGPASDLRFLHTGPVSGLLVPSADRAGRRFPLTLAAAAPLQPAAWYDALAHLATRAATLAPDALESALAAHPAAREGADPLRLQLWTDGAPVETDPEAPAAALDALLPERAEVG